MIQILIMNPTESISIEIKKCCNSYNAAEALKVHTEVAHREYFNVKFVMSYNVHQGSLKGFYNHILSILKHLHPELIFIVTFVNLN